MNRWLWSPVVLGLLGGLLAPACVSDAGEASVDDGDDAGIDSAAEETSARLAPDEAQLCAIAFGVSGRTEIEATLGESDSTRETVDRAILLYTYDDGVSLALHLDRDVFRDFSVYGGRIPACWADAKRKASERPRHNDATDAGVDEADNQT